MMMATVAQQVNGGLVPLSSAVGLRGKEEGTRRGSRIISRRCNSTTTARALSERKDLWCKSTNEGVILEALQLGVSTFLFEQKPTSDGKEEDEELECLLERIEREAESNNWEARVLFGGGGEDGEEIHVRNAEGEKAAEFFRLGEPEDTLLLSERMAKSDVNDTFLVSFESPSRSQDDPVWKIIPAENLIAAKGMHGSKLLPIVQSAGEAKTMLSVLEAGTDGVVLDTDDSSAIAEVAEFLKSREKKETLVEATALEVVFEGMGDRACVDLCSILQPGEGLLCGSFSRGLFLIHSECEETDYINSRPFRVNAGPVHSYVKMPNDRTAYLSELNAGDEVLVVDPMGNSRCCLVGRCKIENRPLVRVDAKLTSSGDVISVFLQNAETVKVVSPTNQGKVGRDWVAVPVSELKPGMKMLCSVSESARHTGIPVEEQIVEK